MNPKIFLFIAYACIFLYVCYKRPTLALASAFAFSPVAFSVIETGFNASLSDLNIALCLPLLLLGRRDIRNAIGLGPIAPPIWFYLSICLLSCVIASQWQSALLTWLQMFFYFVVTTLVFANFCKFRDLTLVPYYTVGVGTIWALVGFATNFTAAGGAKNAFGASFSAVLLVIYSLYATWLRKPSHLRIKAEGRYLSISGLIIFSALIMSLSRGAWIGTVTGLIVVAIYTQTQRLLLKLVACFIPVALIIWSLLPPAIQIYAFNFDSASAYNIKLRYDSLRYAQNLFYQDPLWGAGMGFRKLYDATNVIWSTLAETGIIGLLAFASIFFVFYRWTWKLRKVVTPTDPRFIFISMAVGLMTSRLMHGMVDHYWSRGVITMVWASVGMVLCLSRTLSYAPVQNAVRHVQDSIPQRRIPSPNPRVGPRRSRPRLRRTPLRRATLKRGP